MTTVGGDRRTAANPLGLQPDADSAVDDRYALALGQAVIDSWGELPQEVQHLLFERAIVAGHHTERDESLREQLAAYLHGKHQRTAD